MCGGCANGHYSFFDSCEECPGGRYSSESTMVTIIAWIIVIVLWNVMEVLAETYLTMNTLLLYMQCLSIAQEFAVPWPDSLSAVTTFFSIADFDIGVVDPACVMEWNYYIASGFTLMLPLIFGFFSLLNCVLATIWVRTVGRRRVMGLTLPFFIESEKDLPPFFRQCCATFMSILVILYNELCKKSFSSFLCDTLPDGKQFLTADPTVECGTRDHQTMIGFSILGILVYVVGVPAFFGYVLWRKRQVDELKKVETCEMYGFLYLGIRPDMYGWQLVMLLRRFCLCFIMIFLSRWYVAPS
jgi:hypothetical protein